MLNILRWINTVFVGCICISSLILLYFSLIFKLSLPFCVSVQLVNIFIVFKTIFMYNSLTTNHAVCLKCKLISHLRELLCKARKSRDILHDIPRCSFKTQKQIYRHQPEVLKTVLRIIQMYPNIIQLSIRSQRIRWVKYSISAQVAKPTRWIPYLTDCYCIFSFKVTVANSILDPRFLESAQICRKVQRNIVYYIRVIATLTIF